MIYPNIAEYEEKDSQLARQTILDLHKEIEALNNQLKEKNDEIREYELLVFKVSGYLNCYQYFLETQEENNKKIANMIHDFSLGSDKE